ncbi:MAG TPA: galactokinase, partial [Vicinamibacterales bacterium]
VNLIGEHTDYNDGFMLPTTIPYRTVVELAPRSDRRVRAWSANIAAAAEPVEFRLGDEARTQTWIDYPQGITAALRETGHTIGGFDLRIESNVPVGGGLSSSAALLVSLLRGLRTLFSLTLDDLQLARVAHKAENDLVGAPVGIMDQLVSSLGRPGHALFIDARTLDVEHIPLPPALEVAVINSNVHHSHAGGEYRTRRAECERAASLLGAPALRDVDPAALTDGRIAALPSPLDRRARHVVSENARVLEVVAALRSGDLARAGALVREGHASLRDDFEVSVPEVDALAELANAQPAVYGARLTGGGFGGSVVALTKAHHGREAADLVVRAYRERTGKEATVLLPR